MAKQFSVRYPSSMCLYVCVCVCVCVLTLLSTLGFWWLPCYLARGTQVSPRWLSEWMCKMCVWGLRLKRVENVPVPFQKQRVNVWLSYKKKKKKKTSDNYTVPKGLKQKVMESINYSCSAQSVERDWDDGSMRGCGLLNQAESCFRHVWGEKAVWSTGQEIGAAISLFEFVLNCLELAVLPTSPL